MVKLNTSISINWPGNSISYLGNISHDVTLQQTSWLLCDLEISQFQIKCKKMATREDLDKQYVNFAVKFSNKHHLRPDLEILGCLKLEIFTVSEG